MLKNVLSGCGYVVDVAFDGKQALDLALMYSYDLVITDINMPVMNGIELARFLRATAVYADTPILFLTTEIEEKSRIPENVIKKPTRWLTKPFNPHSLLDAILQAL